MKWKLMENWKLKSIECNIIHGNSRQSEWQWREVCKLRVYIVQCTQPLKFQAVRIRWISFFRCFCCNLSHRINTVSPHWVDRKASWAARAVPYAIFTYWYEHFMRQTVSNFQFYFLVQIRALQYRIKTWTNSVSNNCKSPLSLQCQETKQRKNEERNHHHKTANCELRTEKNSI